MAFHVGGVHFWCTN